MADVEMDTTAVHELTRVVLDSAEAISRISSPTLDSGAMAGSAVVQAVDHSSIDARLADIVTQMRAWADGALAALNAIDATERQQAGRLGP